MSKEAERQLSEDQTVNRREFLKRLAKGAAIGGGAILLGKVGYDSLANDVDRPVIGAEAPKLQIESTTTTTAPETTTTTTQPEVVERREPVPNQHLGTITLSFSGRGPKGEAPLSSQVSVPLHYESRTLDQATSGAQMDENDPELMQGAMLHIDSPLPGAFTKAEAASTHTIPVIAAHRLTPVDGLQHGPFFDIDKLSGDTLTVNYDDNKSFSYKYVSSEFLPYGDELFDKLTQKSDKDMLVIYACADANGQTGNGQVYNPTDRYIAFFERV